MFREFVQGLRDLFTKKYCSGCMTKDYTVQILNEQLREARLQNECLTNQLIDINRHLLRMNTVEKKEVTTEQKTLPVHSRSLSSRIKEAERKSRDEAEKQNLPEQRRKEYDERVSVLMGSEVKEETKEVNH